MWLAGKDDECSGGWNRANYLTQVTSEGEMAVRSLYTIERHRRGREGDVSSDWWPSSCPPAQGRCWRATDSVESSFLSSLLISYDASPRILTSPSAASPPSPWWAILSSWTHPQPWHRIAAGVEWCLVRFVSISMAWYVSSLHCYWANRYLSHLQGH